MHRSHRRIRLRSFAVLLAALAMFSPSAAHADDLRCEGPSECCPTTIAQSLPIPQTVRIGAVVVGLHNVSERAGTWDADFYLYESWHPTPGFTPQTEIVNEVSRLGSSFDVTEWRNGDCLRTRRVRSTVASNYNLRLFPFDQQRLTLEFSDAEFDSRSVRYATAPMLLGLSDEAREQLSSWKVIGDPSFHPSRRAFRWEEGAPTYDYATFSVAIRRHVSFHLLRFFLPLLLIVAMAFTTFWMDPDDLNSQTSVGVTCLLAAIAFQFAQATSLPEVAYLTLADRVYAACYVAIALSMTESVRANALARRGERPRALQLDRRCRVLFPGALGLVVAWSIARSIAESH